MSRPTIRIPEGALLPIVVSDEWLRAVSGARWSCECQRKYRPGLPQCSHVATCDRFGVGPGASRLVVDISGVVLCASCAKTWDASRRRHARQDADARAAMAPSLLDLLDEMTGETDEH